MKTIEFYGGMSIEQAYQALQENKPCCGIFNDITISSTDTLYDIYVKVTGQGRQEFLDSMQNEKEYWVKEESEYRSKIPQLIKEFKCKARGVIPEDRLAYWDSIVPVRLESMSHGYELECLINLIQVLNKANLKKEERMNICKNLIFEQGHGGISLHLVYAGLMDLHPLGLELVKYLRTNKI